MYMTIWTKFMIIHFNIFFVYRFELHMDIKSLYRINLEMIFDYNIILIYKNIYIIIFFLF